MLWIFIPDSVQTTQCTNLPSSYATCITCFVLCLFSWRIRESTVDSRRALGAGQPRGLVAGPGTDARGAIHVASTPTAASRDGALCGRPERGLPGATDPNGWRGGRHTRGDELRVRYAAAALWNVPVLAGAGRQSWQQQQHLMGIGGAVAGFCQSQLAQQQQLALQLPQQQLQQQLLQEQAAAVGVSSPAAQQVAGPWKHKVLGFQKSLAIPTGRRHITSTRSYCQFFVPEEITRIRIYEYSNTSNLLWLSIRIFLSSHNKCYFTKE